MSPWQPHGHHGLRCSPRRLIFSAVVLLSAVWMVTVVFFLASEEKATVRSVQQENSKEHDVAMVADPGEQHVVMGAGKLGVFESSFAGL